jgi:hypothetical protein
VLPEAKKEEGVRLDPPSLCYAVLYRLYILHELALQICVMKFLSTRSLPMDSFSCSLFNSGACLIRIELPGLFRPSQRERFQSPPF